MLRWARLGTFLTFALTGLLCGVWVARMPALADKLHVGPGAIGMVLLVWGLAALAAMQGLRGVIARLGSRTMLRVSLPLSAATAVLVALAPSYGLLLAALAAFGMAFGVTDVAMNAQASVVERAYRRPLMSGMHAGWCVGAMTGGAAGALTALAGLSFTQSLLGTAALALPAALALGRTYLPDSPAAPGARSERRQRLPMPVYLIGALAFIAFMAEGAVADWSGLLLHGELGAPEWLAALGYPLFETAMLTGRLAGDRLRTHLGTRRLLVAAGLGTAAAAGVVLTAPTVPVALAGFFVTGLAVCTIVPTMISLAGTAAPGRSAASVAQVGAMGYGGLLLGPVLIGFLAEATSLRAGLGVVVVAALLVAAGARLLPIAAGTDLASHEYLADRAPEHPVPGPAEPALGKAA
ncbi:MULTISPECIES: MFS transporter [Thermomonospora]|uniref:Major facilitator superfamily MFS_1 n=1 Tax=Thermomonospora curvata (strain ATCC 19995 / DSM 43183 / JCM 3096 / KCTC 9072 / NBRC 15933 / NCIMB 10081 / Henssen B9) TaxID=471852 RepID=D1ABT3_THECD|nr:MULTISPECIES: MFS transporter [Thermomonospora]ACY99106.1 major facilitator superfamily MFS_1 [Thermomonospora curvata DSM 43183]PKK13286.1 MAG: MFS transporter [Thermomonospora sp. CIF 1]